jgi:hypothetical protein
MRSHDRGPAPDGLSSTCWRWYVCRAWLPADHTLDADLHNWIICVAHSAPHAWIVIHFVSNWWWLPLSGYGLRITCTGCKCESHLSRSRLSWTLSAVQSHISLEHILGDHVKYRGRSIERGLQPSRQRQKDAGRTPRPRINLNVRTVALWRLTTFMCVSA